MIPADTAVTRRRGLAAFALCALLLGCSSTEPRSPYGARGAFPIEGARTDFDLAGDRAPSAATLYTMARVAAHQGRDAQCELVLERLIHDHPTFAPGYGELASLYLRHDRLVEARAIVERGLDACPDDAVLLNNLGICAMLAGRHEDALAAFTRASAAAPDDARHRANMACALGLLGRAEEAEALYRQILPEPDVTHNMGVLAAARR